MQAPSLYSDDDESFTYILRAYHHRLLKRERKQKYFILAATIFMILFISIFYLWKPQQVMTSSTQASSKTMTVDLVMMPENVTAPSLEKKALSDNLKTEPVPDDKVPSFPADHSEITAKKNPKKTHTKVKTRPINKDRPVHAKTNEREKSLLASSDSSSPKPEILPTPASMATQSFHTIKSWQTALLTHLEKFKRYPASAMEDSQEGVPLIQFSIDRQGHVLNTKLVKSSDYPLLDDEALTLPKRAQPLPSPPETIKGTVIILTVPVEFTVRQN